MSLIIASGSNLEDSVRILNQAQIILSKHYRLIKKSRIYQSRAVEYLNQPDFFNQVLEFSLPLEQNPADVMTHLLSIEQKFGRVRNIQKGPRTLDLDLIFWGDEIIQEKNLTVPHPKWQERSFVVKPFSELPYFQEIKKRFNILRSFEVDAYPLEND